MHAQLSSLYELVGSPPYSELSKHAKLAGRSLPKQTISSLLNTTGCPLWRTVEAYVVACAGYAKASRRALPVDATDLALWRARHTAMLASGEPPQTPHDEVFAAAREEYLSQIRRRFSRANVEVLLSYEHEEHPPLSLRDIFVAQNVKGNPPPVELPRELMRRLVMAGDVDVASLPEGVTKESLDAIRHSYLGRTAEPVLEVLTKPDADRIVLLGDPGAGKSSLAQYLCLVLSDERERPESLRGLSGWLPILVELRTYADTRWRQGTFLDMLDHLYQTEGMGLPKESLERFLYEGGVALVIFDGLDEIFDPKVREHVTHEISAFAGRYHSIRVLVTSRPVGYKRTILDSSGFTHHMLQDLTREQIEQFVATWYRLSCPDDPAEGVRLCDRVLEAVRSTDAVAELAGNPMLLTILSIIGRRRELPRDRRAVYKHAVSVLVEHWEVNKHLRVEAVQGSPPELDHEDKLELLRRIARRMQDSPSGLAGNHLRGTDLADEFDAYLRSRYQLPAYRAKPAARTMLAQLRERNFILSLFGADVYGFVHRVFLEYLAAEDIVDRLHEREFTEQTLVSEVFGKRWRDPAWHEVLLLVAGLIKEKFTALAIRHLLSVNRGWRVEVGGLENVVLALKCIGEVRRTNALTGIGSIVVDTLVQLCESGAQIVSIEALAPMLSEFLRFPDNLLAHERYRLWYLTRGWAVCANQASHRFTQMHAAERIFTQTPDRSETFRQVLLRWITDPTWTASHVLAAHSPNIESYEDRVGLKEIAWKLPRDTSNAGARATAVELFANRWCSDPNTLKVLLERAVADEFFEVRVAAVAALTGFRYRWRSQVFPLLLERAARDDHHEVRRAAIKALAKIGYEEVVRYAWRPKLLALLIERAARDNHHEVRRAAIKAFAVADRDELHLPWLYERATTDEHEDVRSAVLHLLAGRQPRDPATDAVLRDRAIYDEHPTVRRAALRAVADQVTVEWIMERARCDPDHEVRKDLLVQLMAGSTDASIIEFVQQRGANDQHHEVRRAALERLAQDELSSIEWIRDRSLSDEDVETRIVALAILVGQPTNDPDAAESLRGLAIHSDRHEVRISALARLSLPNINDTTTLSLLRERAVVDAHPTARAISIAMPMFSLQNNGFPDYMGPLDWIRDAATSAIDAETRLVATVVFGGISSARRDYARTVDFLLAQATKDQEPSVRIAAVKFIANAPNWWTVSSAVTDALRNLLLDDDPGVRSVTMWSIAATADDDPSVPALLRERAILDPHQAVRRMATWALARGWPSSLDTLTVLRERMVVDGDEGVRDTARQLLGVFWGNMPALPA